MKTIRATVSGRIILCSRGDGDQVQPGEEILTIESMKMEIPVESDFAGRIAKLLVKEGDEVQEGQALAELD
jgi:acetyl-CoA carboxylase biotin carboxyl carrier protein